jgi:hypothetical protein
LQAFLAAARKQSAKHKAGLQPVLRAGVSHASVFQNFAILIVLDLLINQVVFKKYC